MRLSRLAQNATPSASLAMNAKAKRMAREGQDVVTCGVGEPDFDTPDNIDQAAIRAILSGHTKYTPAAGTVELRQAVARKLLRDNGLRYGPEQILVSNGAKQALYMLMLCLLEAGDEIIVPAPYWLSYTAQAEVCGASAVTVDTTGTDDLKLTPELLLGAITPRSRALVINSPCNPTGVVYSKADLHALARTAVEHDLWILSDEVYEMLIYDGLEHVSTAALDEETFDHTITFNALSKTYAMTGWRIGYAAGPAALIGAAASLQSHLTSGPNSIAQKAACEALDGPQDSVAQMREAFAERRDLIVKGLNSVPGVRCIRPQGAFYAFADCRQLLGHTYAGRRIDDSLALAEALLDTAGLGVLPGSAFGAEGYLRFSYAVSAEDIERAVERLGAFVGTRQD